jgi:hypothetical protein
MQGGGVTLAVLFPSSSIARRELTGKAKKNPGQKNEFMGSIFLPWIFLPSAPREGPSS